MKICPHCSGLPPTLFPHFFVYLALTCVAIGAAVYFRPFLDGPASGQVVNGVLWAAFTIFVFFAIIFTCVCVIVAKDYSHRRFKGKLTKAERIRFINMKQHIESGETCIPGLSARWPLTNTSPLMTVVLALSLLSARPRSKTS